MKRKHFILALVAMLWSFSFSAFADDVIVVRSWAELKAALEANDGVQRSAARQRSTAMRATDAGTGAKTPIEGTPYFYEDFQGTQVKLGHDVVYEDPMSIAKTGGATIDLNGYKVVGATNDDAHTYPFVNNGKLLVVDSSSEKTGAIYCGVKTGMRPNGDINSDAVFVMIGGNIICKHADSEDAALINYGIAYLVGGSIEGTPNAVWNGDDAEFYAKEPALIEGEVKDKDNVEDGVLVVAKIGTVKYTSLNAAFAAAKEGETIKMLADATPTLKSQSAITKAAVIDLNGKTLTLDKGDLYFGTTTFQNGNVVVKPGVNASTAVFWMFANQTLTFDNVDIVATGVTGTYLIGINGGTGTAVNILNGSSITMANDAVAKLTAVICDNGTGNSVTIEDSKIDVKNIEGRFYLGGKNGSVTVENSDVDLTGVKEGFYLRADQTLDITGNSTVDITLNSNEGRYGINCTEFTSIYNKDDLATVNATVYEPKAAAMIGNKKFRTLQEAINAAVDGDVVVLKENITEDVLITQKADLDLTIDGDGKTLTGLMSIDGAGRAEGAETLTIKNVNFIAKEGADACITCVDKSNPGHCYTHNLTVYNCTFTDPDGTINCAAIRQNAKLGGGDVNWTVEKCSVDNTMHSLMNTSAVKNLTVKDCTINSKNGLNLNNSTNVTLTDNDIDVKGYALRLGDNSEIANLTYALNGNKMKSECNDGDAVIVFRNKTANLSMVKNAVIGTTHISGLTIDTKLSVDENYWDANADSNGDAQPTVSGADVKVNSYYEDEARTKLNRNQVGTISAFVYANEGKISGDVTSNAKNTLEIKIIGADGNEIGKVESEKAENLIGTSKLLTWRINLGADNSGSWKMTWNEGAPSVKNMPTMVKLIVDGKEVAEAPVKLTAGGDGKHPVFAAKTDADGKILSFIACTDKFDYTEANSFLQSVPQAGDHIAILVEGTYAVPTKKNLTITGAVEGVKFDMSKAVAVHSSMIFNDVTFEYSSNANYTGLQHAGTMVYNNCTINGQVFLYGESETFNKCTFNQNSADAYNVWTYGAKEAAFNECTFNSAGKSVLIYSDQASATNNVAVAKSQFIASNAVEGKAAIEMDSSIQGDINLTIDESTVTGFGKGNVSGNSLWNNKKDRKEYKNNDITVTVDGTVVLAPAPIRVIYKDGKDYVYDNILEAVPFATNKDELEGATIQLLEDYTGSGIRFYENDMVLDLNGFTYTVNEGTGSNTTRSQGFQVRPEVTGKTTVKNGTVKIAPAADMNAQYSTIAWVFNSYAAELVLEDVTIDMENMAWDKYGDNVYAVVVQDAGDIVKLTGNTSVVNFKESAGSMYLIGKGAQLAAAEDASVTTESDCDINFSEGIHSAFKVVAKIGTTTYSSLEKAVAAVKNGETITLASDCAENIHINKSNVAFTIDGAQKTYTGKIEINIGQNVTIKNVDFKHTADDAVDFIANVGSPTGKNYNTTLLVDACTFTGNGKGNVVAVRTIHPTSLTIQNSTATGLHSMLQNTGGQVVTVDGVTLTDSKGGLAIGSPNGQVTVMNSNLTTATYGVRLDANNINAPGAILEANTINAYIPVVARKATADYSIVFNGANSFTATNGDDGVWCVVGEKEYEEGVTLDEVGAVTGDATVTLNGTGLDKAGIHAVKAAIGNVYYFSFADALAAAEAGKTITMYADVEATEVILLDKSITIDGNGHKVTSNATRVFRVTTSDTKVTLNDVNMVSRTVMVYPNDIRGISIDAGLQNVELTLNNCSVDFTDATACDWAYAVNVSGNGTGHTVTVNGGTYEGANVINVHGANNTVTVKDATLTSLYPANDQYYGAAIWVLQKQNSSVEATGNTFEGNHAIAFNLGTGTDLYESNNTDNTKLYVAKADADKYCYSFADAVAAAENTVKLLFDQTDKGVVIDKNLTIDFNGKTYSFDEGVGSTGTESNGFQILKGNNVTLKNGTLKVADEAKSKFYILVQNYANLTVEDMNLDGTNLDKWSMTDGDSYVLSNNSGNVVVKGKTVITQNNEGALAYALDACTKTGYDAPTVTVEQNVVIYGNVEASAALNFAGTLNGSVVINGVDGKVTTTTVEGKNVTTTVEHYNVIYADGAYAIVPKNYIAQVGDKKFEVFEDALYAVENGGTITLLGGAFDESAKELGFEEAITFTITGEALEAKLPVITFKNATVNIKDAKFQIPELDARQNAIINVDNSTVVDAGGNSIVKSYYNGTINITNNSTVYAMQVTTMGYINIDETSVLNATWQTNVYGNGMISLAEGATFNTAALHLTGQAYSDRDNTAADRVGKPATIVVDGATLNVGKVKSYGGSDYSYNSSKGINVGTVDGKNALLDIKNGGAVNFYMANGQTTNFGAGATVNVASSTLKTICRGEGTVKLANNGTVYVTGEANLDATVTGNGWFYMNGVALDADTKLYGAKVGFINGVNAVKGATVKDGFFSVGIGQNAAAEAAAAFAAANGIALGDVTVNVSENATIGGNGATYSGWVGSAYSADKTQNVYTLNINNSQAAFGYMHVSKDGVLNVDGRTIDTNKYKNDGANVDFYAGDFIVNGIATFNDADAWAKYTKISVDHVGGVLNINGYTKFEASRHNGATTGDAFVYYEAGKVNVAETATVEIDNATKFVDGAELNIAGNVTAKGAITGNGAINFTSDAATLTTGTTGLTIGYDLNKDKKVVYADGAYKVVAKKYVAKIGEQGYESFAEALTAAENDQTVELLWNEGDPAISMAGTVCGNKTVTITGTAQVDWSKGWLYVGRNGEGNGKVIFNEANLTSTEASLNNGTYGINVSMAKSGSNTTNDGEVVFKNSNIDLSVLIGKNNVTVDGGNLTVWYGFAVGARPASETNNVERTVTMNIVNGAKVVVKNHNGQGLGYEAIGVMNIDKTSTFETTQKFLITAKGTMNNAGTVKIAGALTNNGAINFTDLAATLATTTNNLTIGYDPTVISESYKVIYDNNGVYRFAHYVARIDEVYYESLQAALEALEDGKTLVLLEDIEISDKWSTFGVTAAATIDGNGYTLTFTGEVNDADNYNGIFRFENNMAVKNLTIDASQATGIERAISAKLGITVDNCEFIGKGNGYAVIFGEGAEVADLANAEVSITNSTFTNWSKGVSDNANGEDAKNVTISKNEFTNASVNVSASVKVTFTENKVVDGDVIITSYSNAEEVQVYAGLTGSNNLKNGNGIYQIISNPNKIYAQDDFSVPVANIVTEYYLTLQEAIDAADNSNIILLDDIRLAEAVVVEGKTATLNLNGNWIRPIDNTVTMTGGLIRLLEDANLTIAGEGEITSNGNHNVYAAVSVLGDNASLTVNSGKLTGYYYGIAGNGYREGTKVTINGGEIASIEATGAGIYHPQNGTLTVTDGTITGATGIYFKGGNLAISGGTVKGTGAKADYVYSGNGFNATGDALVIENVAEDGYEAIGTVSITGGTFISDNAAPIASYGDSKLVEFLGNGCNAQFNKVFDESLLVVGYQLTDDDKDGLYIVEFKHYRQSMTIVDGAYTNFVNEIEDFTIGTLTYERIIPAAGNWYPLYVPFEIPVEELTELGYEAAFFYDVHFKVGAGGVIDPKSAPEVHLIKIKEGTLKAHFPYVIRASKDANLNLSLKLKNATLFTTTDPNAMNSVESGSTINRFIFAGTYNSANSATLTGNADIPCYAVTNDGGWAQLPKDYALTPFRVFMSIVSKNGSPVILDQTAGSIKMRVIGEENEDGTTTIYDVEYDNETVDYIYDVQGRRVLEPQKGGVYIINGKKVVF